MKKNIRLTHNDWKLKDKIMENFKFRKTVNYILKEHLLSPLTEQAMKKYDAEQYVTALSNKINEHVFKCLIYGPDCQALSHWFDEINAWIDAILSIRLKQSNDFIPVKYILSWGMEIFYKGDSFSQRGYDLVFNFASDNQIGVGSELMCNNQQEILSFIKEFYLKSYEDRHSKIKELCDVWFENHKDVYFQ